MVHPGNLDERATKVEELLGEIDRLGSLVSVDPHRLSKERERLRKADEICDSMLRNHRRNEPNVSWMLLSVFCATGSIASLATLAPAGLVVLGGSILSTAWSVRDFYAFKHVEDSYRSLQWRVGRHLATIEGILGQS